MSIAVVPARVCLEFGLPPPSPRAVPNLAISKERAEGLELSHATDATSASYIASESLCDNRTTRTKRHDAGRSS